MFKNVNFHLIMTVHYWRFFLSRSVMLWARLSYRRRLSVRPSVTRW